MYHTLDDVDKSEIDDTLEKMKTELCSKDKKCSDCPNVDTCQFDYRKVH